ncbi:MAG: signal peptidase I [Pirellulaceae bacterium]
MPPPKNKRRPFETDSAPISKKPVQPSPFEPSHGSVFRFFQQHGIRETVESIIIAVVLAMMFRTFGGEAYIIPTGSMAPTLQGQHMDVHCDKCNTQYLTGSSDDNSTVEVSKRRRVTTTFCPFCRSPMVMRPSANAEHVSNQGDRIVVNKFIYDFMQPRRFDVIVFKNPNNGKQNYIKRLVGLPNEKLKIENGDLFTMESADGKTWNSTIVRKPDYKLKAMLQIVDDTNFIAAELHKANWPLRWNEWANLKSSAWSNMLGGNRPVYSIGADASDKKWLRYRHLLPNPSIWEQIKAGKTFEDYASAHFGELIGDYYCYNQRRVAGTEPHYTDSPALHWVGDLALQADVEIKSGTGKLYFDLVEGGVHFEVTIDVATGTATLTNSAGLKFYSEDRKVETDAPTADSPIRGPGKYEVMFSNTDDQLRLWINGRQIRFDADCYDPSRRIHPAWSRSDPGDAEPLGVAATGLAVSVSRLRVWRDIYYSSVKGYSGPGNNSRNETQQDAELIRNMMENPQSWDSPGAKRILGARFRDGGPMFELEEQQFLPMGDNSPDSLDARIWNGDHFVSGELMIGRALYVFWPHAKSAPIPYWPNFERMGPIR